MTVLGGIVALPIGFAGGMFSYPGWEQRSDPNDGQAGLSAFLFGLVVAAVFGLLVSSLFWKMCSRRL